MKAPVLFGEVLFDRFSDGSEVLGGAPFNVAWNLTALGAPALLVSRVGDDDLGERIRQAMAGRGMDLAGLQVDTEHATGTVDVTMFDGEPHYDIVAGRAWDFIQADELPAAVRGRPLYHGTLAARADTSAHCLQRLLTLGVGAARFVDVNLRTPWWQADAARALLRGAWVVKLNHAELGLLQPGADDEARMRTLRRELQIDTLLVTFGERGAVARRDDAEPLRVLPERNIDAVDPVGAGDAFASVLLLGALLDWPLAQSLRRAQQFASAVVGLRGATSTDDAFYAGFRNAWSLT